MDTIILSNNDALLQFSFYIDIFSLFLGVRAIHMRHTYDFYKPKMSCEYPVVDGPMSVEGYLNSIDRCYALYRDKLANVEGMFLHIHLFTFYSNNLLSGRIKPLTLDEFDACLFHSPYSKLVQKSLARLRFLDVIRNPEQFSTDPANATAMKFK